MAAAAGSLGGSEIVTRLRKVLGTLESVCKKHKIERVPRLVAVSKRKSVDDIRAAYDAGQRHFGENYVQELMEKSTVLPRDIHWHMIGHLQSNKCRDLVNKVPNLTVETVDSAKLARELNKRYSTMISAKKKIVESSEDDHGRMADESAETSTTTDRDCDTADDTVSSEKKSLSMDDDYYRTLPVFIQVNTSGESSKSGVIPGEPVAVLARLIREECDSLRLVGLMTIGQFLSEPTDTDFQVLKKCRNELALALGDASLESALELSMGMSNDFELATQCGSTSVRVGSAIFGARS